MATTKSATSPFTSVFNSAIRRGTPAGTAVQNIAKRTRKTQTQVFNSLFRADQVKRQKIAGQWVFFPVNGTKSSAKIARNTQAELWQAFVDWTIASGQTTPERIADNNRSSKQFITFLKKFFGRQFASTSAGSTSGRRTTSTHTQRSSSKRTASSRARRSTTSRSGSTSTQTRRRRTSTTQAAKRRASSTTASKRRSTTSSRKSTSARGRSLRLTGTRTSGTRRLSRAA